MTLKQFKALNKRAGLHWFDKETLRFFSSTVMDWDSVSGVFLTRERTGFDREAPLAYTIRLADFKTGRVSTLSKFNEFNNYETAVQAFYAELSRRRRGDL